MVQMPHHHDDEKPLPPLPTYTASEYGLPSHPRAWREENLPLNKDADFIEMSTKSEGENLVSKDNQEEYSDILLHDLAAVEHTTPPQLSHDGSSENLVGPGRWTSPEDNDYQKEKSTPPYKQGRGWKPFTLKSPLLLMVILVSLAFIAIIQYLSYKSRANGGILFASSVNAVSAADTFGYLYAPIVVAVLFSITWTWIDLDAKRVEPYLRLCSEQGTSAKDSINLNYATAFIALVPFKAARARHWAVLTAGLAVVAVFWAVTPLTSAIFTLDEIYVTSAVDAIDTATLAPLGNQIDLLNGNIFNEAYNYLWHNSSLPPFTTEKLIVVPFGFAATDKEGLTNSGSLLINATSYFTKLDCSQPLVVGGCTLEENPAYHSTSGLSTGDGCLIQEPRLGAEPGYLSISYDGWHQSPQGPGFSICDCPNKFSNYFLAGWANSTTKLSIFCKTQYFSQPVQVTANTLNWSISTALPNGNISVLDPNIFNTTNFDFLLATAISALSESDTAWNGGYGAKYTDIVDSFIIDAGARSSFYYPDISTRLDLGRYVIPAQDGNIGALGDPEALALAFENIHQLLFSMAAPHLFIMADNGASPRQGLYSRSQAAVTVDATFTNIASGALLFVACLGALLLLITSTRRSYLSEDPATIISNMRMLSRSLQNYLTLYPRAEENDQGRDLFRIRQNPHNFQAVLEHIGHDDISTENPKTRDGQWSTTVQNPFELRSVSLSILVVALCASIIGLCVMKARISQRNGISIPSDNTFLSRAILNYLPTALATLLESYWVLLTRTSSYLWPYEGLRRGGATVKSTIGAAYPSLPPQLILWPAAKNKHLTLSLLCIVTVLANLLAISTSGLFQTLTTPIDRPISLTQTIGMKLEPNLTLGGEGGNTDYDYISVAASTLSGRSKPPTWANGQNFFAHFRPQEGDLDIAGSLITAQTPGFGLGVSCSATDITTLKPNEENTLYPDLNIPDDGDLEKCKVRPLGGFDFSLNTVDIGSTDRRASEAIWLGSNVGPCNRTILLGWFRTPPRANETLVANASTSTSGHVPPTAGTILFCSAQYQIADFNVTVNNAGDVQGAVQASPFSDEPLQYFQNNTSAELLLAQLLDMLTYKVTSDPWHNETFAAHWLNYLLKTASNSSTLVDPQASLPDAPQIEGLVEKVIQQAFVIYISLNPQWLLDDSSAQNRTVQGSVRLMEARVFYSTYMFEISVSLLSLNLLVAVLVWIRRPTRFLREMPTTIGAIGSHFVHSTLLREVQEGLVAASSDEVNVGYGKFVGTDGKPHQGIERYPFVTT